jgi:hypothetical protein
MGNGLRARLDELHEFLNWVNDQDRQWWPFLFLRPPQHERMSSSRVLGVSALLGLFVGMLTNLAVVLTVPGGAARLAIPPLPAWLTLPLFTSALFFVFFRFTFAASWNWRAGRMAAAKVRARR